MDVFDVETAAARSARLMQVAGKGWIAWLDRASLGMRDVTQAGRDLAGCHSTADLLKLQRSWAETAVLRGVADLCGALELMRAAMTGVADVDAERAPDGAQPAAGPEEPIPARAPVLPPVAGTPRIVLPEAAEPGAPAAATPEPVSGGEPAKAAKPARRPRARPAGAAARRGR